MAKVLVFHYGPKGAGKSGVAGEGADFTFATQWEELSGKLSGRKAYDLVILDSVPAEMRTEITRRIKKLNNVPVIYFEEGTAALPPGDEQAPLSGPMDHLMDLKPEPKAKKPKKKSAPDKASSPLELARRKMDDHFRESITLTEIASYADMSTSYFCRKFKSKYGVTPISYLRNLRIARACHLLENTDLPLKEITEQSGFLSVPYFCREFRKEKGMPPMHYRRKFSKIKK